MRLHASISKWQHLHRPQLQSNVRAVLQHSLRGMLTVHALRAAHLLLAPKWPCLRPDMWGCRPGDEAGWKMGGARCKPPTVRLISWR